MTAGRSGRHRGWLAAVLAAVCLTTAGCWDRVEIQERAFVLAVAIDVPEAGAEKEPGKARVESDTAVAPSPRYRVTLQLLRLGGGKAGGEKPGGGETRTYLVSSTGRNVFEAERDMLGESSRVFWFENIQAIILSQAVVERYGLAAPLDLFRRDGEMRWRAQVFVTPGEARKIVAVQPPSGEPGGIYLAETARHKKNVYLATARSDMAFATRTVDNGTDAIFPVVEVVGNGLKLKGGAMFKKNRFLGYMDEYTIQGLRLIRATEKSALISFECPQHPGSTVTFELFRHNTILKARGKGDKVRFTLDIAMRGNFGEIQCEHLHDTMSPDYIIKAQDLFAEAAKRNIEHTLAVCRALGWESFYMRKTLQAYEPQTWEQIKDHWDELYPTIPVDVSVRVSVVNVGEHK